MDPDLIGGSADLGAKAVEKVIEKAGWFNKMHSRLLKSAAGALKPGEQPIAIAQARVGRASLRDLAVTLTDRRLIFHKFKVGWSVGDLAFTVQLSDITSAKWRKVLFSYVSDSKLKIEKSDGSSLFVLFARASRKPGKIIGESVSGAARPIPGLSRS